MLASSLFYVAIGHFNARHGVTFFLQLALSAFLLAQREHASPQERRGWMLIAWAGAALGVLSKGLIALVLPAATLALYSSMTCDFAPWRRLHVLAGGALFLLIAAPC